MSVPVPHTAMVLAAGLGTRMRPLTDATPKPLLKVRGKALIDRLLDPLAEAGVKRVVINVHYLADQIEAYAAALKRFDVIISDERAEVLETGGAIAKARPLLGDEPIFVMNTDAFWAPESPEPFLELAAAFDPQAEDERLLIAETGRALGFDGPGDFFLQDNHRLIRRGAAPSSPWAYAGVRIMKPQLYDTRAVERFSAVKIWDELIPQGRLAGHPLDRFWLHVGDPQALADADMWIACHGG
ncbi:nucleotidyltransferase family protein [Hyphomonas sp.]|uniref:nucleotidyltransferase family protein n=1 Tax=Hyphomonas sp. TaxID=87 RepID=UPI00391A3E5C